MNDRFKEIENNYKNRLKVAEENFKHDFKHIEKRINDVQKFPTFIISALAVIIIGIGLFSAFNLNNQIERLRQFETETKNSVENARKEMKSEIELSRNELKNEIKASFEKSLRKPDIILLSDIDKPLEGHTLTAEILPATTEGKKFRLEITVIFKNQGKGTSDPLVCKLYTTDDLPFGGKSSDERDFSYETYFSPEKIPIKNLPAGASATLNTGFNIGIYNERIEKFPLLIKVYYGGVSPARSEFFLEIPKK